MAVVSACDNSVETDSPFIDVLQGTSPAVSTTPSPLLALGGLEWSVEPASSFKLKCVPYQISRTLSDGTADTSSSPLNVGVSAEAGASFFSDASCTTGITSTIIAAQQSQTTVYLKGTTSGTKLLTASSSSLQTGTRSAVISDDLFGDDFSSGLIAASRWNQWPGSIPVVSQSNIATMIPVPNSSWSGFASAFNFDFTGHELTAELTLDSNFDVNNYAILYLCGSVTCYDFAFFQGNINATIDSGSTIGSAPYDPTQHRFLKIAHDASLDQMKFFGFSGWDQLESAIFYCANA